MSQDHIASRDVVRQQPSQVKIPHICPKCNATGIENITRTGEPDEQHICNFCGGNKVTYSDGKGNWI